MERVTGDPRWGVYAQSHWDLLEGLCSQIRERGPLGNRDFVGGAPVRSFRGRRDSALGLYALWLLGRLMIHHRRGFDRVYDLAERIAPPALLIPSEQVMAEDFFARKAVALRGFLGATDWARSMSSLTRRRIAQEEAQRWLCLLLERGEIAPVRVEGTRATQYVLRSDLSLLDALEEGAVPQVGGPSLRPAPIIRSRRAASPSPRCASSPTAHPPCAELRAGRAPARSYGRPGLKWSLRGCRTPASAAE